MILAIIGIWYIAALLMNGNQLINQLERKKQQWTYSQVISQAYQVKRPILPAPHQVALELKKSVFDTAISSKHFLVHHSLITLNSTMLGFFLGSVVGIVIAIGIVHICCFQRSNQCLATT
ncbi:hypothetical protein [Agarivorans litoreus]|uniref:hypothetical protein n=1 Tax=Agarivorans litoreus TaxID=1510455 RepID=UPI001C7DA729|nr:hypothetical protein [Agarivorans litoreus]